LPAIGRDIHFNRRRFVAVDRQKKAKFQHPALAERRGVVRTRRDFRFAAVTAMAKPPGLPAGRATPRPGPVRGTIFC